MGHEVVGILKSIKTCPDAYAIFETEAARDTAVDTAVQSGGIASWPIFGSFGHKTDLLAGLMSVAYF